MTEALYAPEGRDSLQESEERGLHSFDRYQVWNNVIDEGGHVRLGKTKEFFKPLTQESLAELTFAYESWLKQNEYLVLKGTNLEGEQKFLAVKCSKRGNDVFIRRLDARLGFFNGIKGVSLFKGADFTTENVVRSNLLWVTLTYDSKRCTLNEAWQRISEEWNLWKTNIENKYGHVDALKFIQAFPGKGSARGYPHIHAVLLFKEADFQVFPHMETNDEGELELAYRISEKDQVEDQGKWHSWIDIKALSSVGAAVNYCRKYAQSTCYVATEGFDKDLAEDGSQDKAVLTSSLLWLFEKQTYSMSHGFKGAMHDLIALMQGSKTFQAVLDGKPLPLWSWQCLGVFDGMMLGLDPGTWTASLEAEDVDRLISRRAA